MSAFACWKKKKPKSLPLRLRWLCWDCKCYIHGQILFKHPQLQCTFRTWCWTGDTLSSLQDRFFDTCCVSVDLCDPTETKNKNITVKETSGFMSLSCQYFLENRRNLDLLPSSYVIIILQNALWGKLQATHKFLFRSSLVRGQRSSTRPSIFYHAAIRMLHISYEKTDADVVFPCCPSVSCQMKSKLN